MQNWNISKLFKLLLVSSIVFLSGCATNINLVEPQDPYENYNRKIFAFNSAVDHAYIRPLAKVYDRTLPNPVKKGIGNFFSNIGNVANIANDLLQLNIPRAAADSCRFVVNTTIGVVGFFDVANEMGLAPNNQDFGLTLAKWGSKQSPYLVLPFFGPSTLRDAAGLVIHHQFLSIWPYIEPAEVRYELEIVKTISLRERLLMADQVIDQAFDPYIFVRNAYLQRRSNQIDRNAGILPKDAPPEELE